MSLPINDLDGNHTDMQTVYLEGYA